MIGIFELDVGSQSRRIYQRETFDQSKYQGGKDLYGQSDVGFLHASFRSPRCGLRHRRLWREEQNAGRNISICKTCIPPEVRKAEWRIHIIGVHDRPFRSMVLTAASHFSLKFFHSQWKRSIDSFPLYTGRTHRNTHTVLQHYSLLTTHPSINFTQRNRRSMVSTRNESNPLRPSLLLGITILRSSSTAKTRTAILSVSHSKFYHPHYSINELTTTNNKPHPTNPNQHDLI